MRNTAEKLCSDGWDCDTDIVSFNTRVARMTEGSIALAPSTIDVDSGADLPPTSCAISRRLVLARTTMSSRNMCELLCLTQNATQMTRSVFPKSVRLKKKKNENHCGQRTA